MVFAPVWGGTGGTIDSTGLYTAGDAAGVWTVTAADTAIGLQGQAEILIAARLPGDVTGNGVVTAYDAGLILRHNVGDVTLTGNDSIAADVTGNATISAYDAALVLQYVVRKITRFPVEEAPIAKVVYASRTMRIGEMETPGDGRMYMPILIDEMEGVIAGEVALSVGGYEGAVEIRSGTLTSDYLLAHTIQTDRIRASFAGAESRAGSGPVLEIVFDESDIGVLSSLTLDRVVLNEGRIPVQVISSSIPTAYRLYQNHPNPFNPQTTIRYDVAKTGVVRMFLYALTGQRIRTLVRGVRPAGSYSVTWDSKNDAGREVASGVYLCRMEMDEYRAVRKLVLVR